jgi:Zn-dependent alcohol dehydrogenase
MRKGLELGFDKWRLIHPRIVGSNLKVFKLLFLASLVAGSYRAGRFRFDRLVRTYPFEAINEAARAAGSGEVIKRVLLFGARG